jgi:hypothetical protein
VISRIGTGEVPVTGEFEALLLQPETFSTVTFMFPLVVSTSLMKTCRKPTIVTGGSWLPRGNGAPALSKIGTVMMLLLVVIMLLELTTPDCTSALPDPALI